MDIYSESLEVMSVLFAKDYHFALATVKNNVPSIRFIDAFFDDGVFYIVTYSKSQKVEELTQNSNVSLCNRLYRFSGKAYNIGHPTLTENKEIREKLIKVFEPWYFEHNNENDENMCYVKVELEQGFFYKDGTGYKVNFVSREVEKFPFDFDLIPIS